MSIAGSRNYQSRARGADENLLCLLGLSGCRRILVVGASLVNWASIFPNYHLVEDRASLADNINTYDLILYHSCFAPNWKEFLVDLGRLAVLRAESGWIVFFVENFLSPINFKKNGIVPSRLIGRYRFGSASILRSIEQEGLKVVKNFIGIPAFGSPEELVLPSSGLLELPPSAHPFLRFFRSIGCYLSVADGMVMLVGAHKLEECGVLGVLLENIHKVSGSKEEYVLERLDFRLRGTLILYLIERTTRKKNFICRVVSDPEIQKVVRRNQVVLDLLQQTLSDQKLLKILPVPMKSLVYKQSTIFVESMLNGIPAWKVGDDQKKAVIFQGAHDFITAFSLATRSLEQEEAGWLEKILAPDIEKICDCPGVSLELSKKLRMMSDRLFKRGAEDVFYLSMTHGDYGYGNILVDPDNGQLTGVIDWDTCRKRDLPGIDYLNLLVQKYRAEKGCGVAEAFIKICCEILQRGALDEHGFYATEFNLIQESLTKNLYCGLIRYMSRSAQYPDVFNSEQNDYLKSLAFLEDTVPL